METILNLTYLYLLVILLALLVERTMEVIMACWNVCELKLKAYRYWNRRTRKLMEKFSGEVVTRLRNKGASGFYVRKRIRHYTAVEQVVLPGHTVTFSSHAVRHVFVRTFAMIVTSVLGIVICSVAGINLFALVKTSLAPDTIPVIEAVGPRLQGVISGLIVGLGAEPVHKVVKALEDSRKWLENRNTLKDSLGNTVAVRVQKLKDQA